MKVITFLPVTTIAFSLVGCATSTEKYSPPADPQFVSKKVVAKPFDMVWDALIKDLSSDFFVINNIDRASRLVNISFAGQRASDFVDCGLTTRSFSNAGGLKTWTYNPADPAAFITTNQQSHGFYIQRSTRLTGRANVYVEPENNGTSVSANVSYEVAVSVEALDTDRRPAGTQNYVYSVATRAPFRSDDVTCVSRGIIEQRLLRSLQ